MTIKRMTKLEFATRFPAMWALDRFINNALAERGMSMQDLQDMLDEHVPNAQLFQQAFYDAIERHMTDEQRAELTVRVDASNAEFLTLVRKSL